MQHLYSTLLALTIILALSFSACDTDITGDPSVNQPPQTFTSVDTIIRFGDDRLESRVEISWWGDDPDGFVKGFEFTFDNPISDATDWNFTVSTDSVFLLSTPVGQDTADFRFSVRAIDNFDLVDPTPANATFPVKNSKPIVSFTGLENLPEISFPVFRQFWQGSDPDGDDNLSHFELYLNDTTTTPYILEETVSSAIFVAEDPKLTGGTVNASVFVNNSADPESTLISGLKLDEYNNLYIRAVDQSAAVSPFAVSDSLYIRSVKSDVLVVNAYSGGGDPVQAFYTDRVTNFGFTEYDSLQLFNSGFPLQQSADNPTQTKVFELFDLIIWFGNNADKSLALAQRTTADFFEGGGKLFMSFYVSSTFDEQSNFLDFTPIAQLTDPSDTTLLLDNGAAITALAAGYPDLQSTAIFGVVKPIEANLGATPYYNADITARDNLTLTLGPWGGNSTIMAGKFDGAGNLNFLITTLELHKLDGLSTSDALFNQIFTDFGY